MSSQPKQAPRPNRWSRRPPADVTLPLGNRRPRQRVFAPVLIGLGALVLAGGLMFVVAHVASNPDSGVKIQLGADEFDLGRADRWTTTIARTGPLLFQAVNGDIDLFLNHTGTQNGVGWSAFLARADGADRATCSISIDRATKQLRDPCTGAVYPPDGGTLRHYPVRVDDHGHVVVTLRAQR